MRHAGGDADSGESSVKAKRVVAVGGADEGDFEPPGSRELILKGKEKNKDEHSGRCLLFRRWQLVSQATWLLLLVG